MNQNNNNTLKLASRGDMRTFSFSREIEFSKHKDGRVEIFASEATKKFNNQRWYTQTALMLLTAEQVTELKQFLLNDH